MKKLFPLIFFLLFAFEIQAQYKPFVFGLRVGANLGWIKPTLGDDYSSEGVRPGFTWGFVGEYFIMENYAIISGFNVNFNGGKLEYPYNMDTDGDDTLETGTMNRKYSLKYIQIPICFKMQTALTDRITAFAKIGLGTSFCLSAKANDEFDAENGEDYSESKKNINDDIALMRESLIVGGGVELNIKGSTALIIDLTYDNAFNNLLTGENPALGDEKAKAIHNFLELGVGIVF